MLLRLLIFILFMVVWTTLFILTVDSVMLDLGLEPLTGELLQ